MVSDMGRSSFQFKQFIIEQARCGMKVTTDSCLFGAWVASKMDTPNRILDIGAGTGLLSLMLAQDTRASIDAVEIEAECFIQLKENLEASSFSEKIKPIHLDIKEFQNEQEYDVIISNPPFHQDQLQSVNEKVNYARHDEGLTIEELCRIASSLAHESGKIFILLPHYRKIEFQNLINLNGLHIQELITVSHSNKHLPFRVMFMVSKVDCPFHEEEIFIHDENGKYTDRFTGLLQPYYLYL
jgi:tRNA1Val (adenine37-N6)-methyltransferase